MKKLEIIATFSVIIFLGLLFIGFYSYMAEEERYYLKDSRPGIWIIGTTTNAIIVQPKVSNFKETEEYFLGYCDPEFKESPHWSEETKNELREQDIKHYKGYFVVSKDASICATALTKEEYLKLLSELKLNHSEQGASHNTGKPAS